MNFIALTLARLAAFAVKISGRGSGSALPGLIVERLKPEILETSLKSIPGGVVVVTGTNGKTTTTKMLVEMLEARGQKVLTNRSGSNFTRGILSMIVRHSTMTGRLKYDIAVLELDEAYAPIIAKRVPPKLVVALNVHRDQLDRYGEINNTAKMIAGAMQHARYVVVNGDDPALVEASENLNGPTVGYFGVSQKLLKDLPTDDELHGRDDDANNLTTPKFVTLTEYSQESATFEIDGKSYQTAFQLPGVYNAVNAAAAIMAAIELLPNDPREAVIKNIAHSKPAFGRGERFSVNDKMVVFGLVKNPSGFNHNLSSMLAAADTVLIAINDDYADGRDVSWLWDVHFDQYAATLEGKTVLVAGVRADDMMLRLQQDGITAEKIAGAELDLALQTGLQKTAVKQTLAIFPTYTAMLALRNALGTKTKVDDIW